MSLASYPRNSYPRMVHVGFGIIRVARNAADHRAIERETMWVAVCGVIGSIVLAAVIAVVAV